MSNDPNKSRIVPPAGDEVSALKSIVEGTARSFGSEFFQTMVRHLAEALGVRDAFVAEFVPPDKARTLAFWSAGRLIPNIEFRLPGTPCERVVGGEFCHMPSGVESTYPEREKGIESYIGVPLKGADGAVFGHLCARDVRPMPEDPRKFFIFEIFAARTSAEFSRLEAESKLRESENRFRDLFEEAPIAYVNEDLQSRFIAANRAARRILGITAEQVSTTVGRSLVPDTPEAQRWVREAFESVGRGTDTSGVVLELRRQDNGKPIFIQWWSKPQAGGAYTRTMFIDITDRVLMEREQARLQAQNLYLQEEIKSVHNFDEIVGASHGLANVLEKVCRVAPTDASVLICGETGTGKELIARAIHSSSNRADRPFIKINCAALPAGLVESELFGHERGAFSGAIQKRIGRFELAHTGTIFLDEIGEVPHDVQVKLLRVLQEREFERIGGNQTIKSDVRVVAATNRDLPKAIAEGDFRADLFYRLNVFPITIPALRDRREDIPLLVQFFAQKYGPRVSRRIEAVDGESMRHLVDYHWPGNIRELENIIERALILGNSPTLLIDPEVFAVATNFNQPSTTVAIVQPAGDSDSDLESVQREHILKTLRKTNWVIEGARGAAKQLGINPATLRHRMKKLRISRSSDPA
jgi:PAS domain S-box-containing protein